MNETREKGVRLARLSDVDAIYKLLVLMHEENGVFSFDEGLVRASIISLTQNRNAGVVGVAESSKGEVAATVGLSMMQGAWYTQDRMLYELWSFVHPGHRRATHAKDLIAFSKQCADLVTEGGSPLSFFSMVKEGDATRRKQELYNRQAEKVGSFSFYLYSPPKKATHEPA